MRRHEMYYLMLAGLMSLASGLIGLLVGLNLNTKQIDTLDIQYAKFGRMVIEGNASPSTIQAAHDALVKLNPPKADRR